MTGSVRCKYHSFRSKDLTGRSNFARRMTATSPILTDGLSIGVCPVRHQTLKWENTSGKCFVGNELLASDSKGFAKTVLFCQNSIIV